MTEKPNQAETGRAERARSVGWALAGLSLSMLLSSLSTSIVNVALPTLALAFNASFGQVQWIVIAYLLAITSLIVSVGRLGDLMGRRRLLMVGIALFTVSSALSGVAPTLWLLFAARAVQGIGAAIMMTLSMALIGETVPKEQTGSAMGLLATMSAIGTALGPALGGVLITSQGWQSVFLVNVPLGVLTLTLAASTLPRDAARLPTARAGFDAIGTLLLALTLAAYALGVTVQFSALNVALLLIAVCGAGLFVFTEQRVTSPLIRLVLFSDPSLRASLIMGALVSTVLMTTLVVGPFYLSRTLGLNPAGVGLILSVGPFAAALSGVLAGLMADRIGARRLTTAGLSAIAIGCLLLACLPATLGVLGYVTPIIVVTIGYALFQTANNTEVMKNIGQDQRGVISGLLHLSRNLGLMTGAAVMGSIFALASGINSHNVAHPDAVANGMHVTFAVATLLIVLALAIGI